MKVLLFVLLIHVKGELTPRRMYQLVPDAETAALTLFGQQKQASLSASVTGELFEIDLIDRTINKMPIPVVRFETIGG
ncbi:MAG TPA: hypothetical protein P5110_06865 [Candidatus Omnitrophota bacterium]|nr:hypothetical protein [Candidatus Omnitrophota bacterium]